MENLEQTRLNTLEKLKQFEQVYQQYLIAKGASNRYYTAEKLMKTLPERLATLTAKKEKLAQEIEAEKQERIKGDFNQAKEKSLSFLAFSLTTTLIGSLLGYFLDNEFIWILGSYILPICFLLMICKTNSFSALGSLKVKLGIVVVAIIAQAFFLTQENGIWDYLRVADFLEISSLIMVKYPFFLWIFLGGILFFCCHLIAVNKKPRRLNMTNLLPLQEWELNSTIGEIRMLETQAEQFKIELNSQNQTKVDNALQAVLSEPIFAEMRNYMPIEFWDAQFDPALIQKLISFLAQKRAETFKEAIDLYFSSEGK